MSLIFEEEGSLSLPLECEELANRVIDGALDYIGCPYETQINLLLTMNEEIKEMNKNFRDIDRETDVLSFPMIEYKVPGEFLFLEERDECFDPESGELVFGDIVISKEKVVEQAESYGHSIEREYAFLIVHSILHLSGFDHIEEDDRIIMEEKQRQIMNYLQISR